MHSLFKSTAIALLRQVGLLEIIKLKAHAIKDYGWEVSAKKWASIDATENPIPWLTYPAIDFLSIRVNKDMRIFEYGCGNSTLWWATHAHKVLSVEHNEEWYNKITPLLPKNANIKLKELSYGGEYCETSKHGAPYEVIIIDGRDRVNCIKQSINNLSDTGVIILDNSDRSDYQEGIVFLRKNGFKQLPLRGLAPIVTYISETSIFYRSNNCLDI